MIEELSPEMIYTTPSLSNSERAMLRRSGTSFAEIDTSSVLRFNDDGSIQVISGEASYGQGIYVTCPHCGPTIYVTLPYCRKREPLPAPLSLFHSAELTLRLFS